MSNLRGVSALVVTGLMGAVLLAAGRPSFQPVELISAGDIQYPWASVADGIVVLRVATDRSGTATATSALRSIASLTAPAATTVQAWKFRPASSETGPLASAMTVAIVFRPAVVVVAPPTFQAVRPAPESGYTPTGIQAVGYPEYPFNVVASGTVVLQVAVDASGRTGTVETIRGIVPLTTFAVHAARTWRFEAARMNGRPVPSKVAIAFVFRLPLTGQ